MMAMKFFFFEELPGRGLAFILKPLSADAIYVSPVSVFACCGCSKCTGKIIKDLLQNGIFNFLFRLNQSSGIVLIEKLEFAQAKNRFFLKGWAL